MDKHSDIFLSVIEKNKGIIYKIANSYCKVEADRKDLIQEIIIQIWRSFSKYDDRFQLSTWVFRIALNVSISFYRKNRVRNENTVEISDLIQHSLYEDAPTEEDSNLMILQEFIRELKELDKALILLYLEGKSQKEISQILGITPTHISTKIARIKGVLKQKFSSLNNQDYAGQ